MAGFREFLTGEVLTAANVNNFLMKQSVMVFADDAARTAALGGEVAEGMLTYNEDTAQLEVFDGAAFVSAAPAPAAPPAGIGPNVVDGSILTAVSTTGTADVTSLSITPSSATAKILILASGIIRIGPNSTNSLPSLQLTDTSNTALYQGDLVGSRSQRTWGQTVANISNAGNFATMSFSIVCLHSPATSSAFTYKLRAISSSAWTLQVGTSSTTDSNDSFTMRTPTSFVAIEVAA